MKFRLLTLATILLMASCGGETNDKDSKSKDSDKNQESQVDSSETAIEDQGDAVNMPTTFFKGKIDGKYEVYAMVHSEEGVLTGKYYYTSMKKLIDLKGGLYGNSLEMDEFYKNKKTGSWKGTFDDSGNWNGDWSGNNKQFTFALSEVTEDEYISTLNSKDDAHSDVLAFDDLINLFKSVDFPFEPKHLTEGFIDTLDYQHYFNEDEEFMSGWGFHELTPGYHVSTSFGHLLLVYHFYTPGAFGIQNTFIELYSFDFEGNQLDAQEIGCYCYDSNMGANDYYATDDKLKFDENGVDVFSTHEHGTLFDEEVEDGEESFLNTTTSQTRFEWDENGKITKVGE